MDIIRYVNHSQQLLLRRNRHKFFKQSVKDRRQKNVHKNTRKTNLNIFPSYLLNYELSYVTECTKIRKEIY